MGVKRDHVDANSATTARFSRIVSIARELSITMIEGVRPNLAQFAVKLRRHLRSAVGLFFVIIDTLEMDIAPGFQNDVRLMAVWDRLC